MTNENEQLAAPLLLGAMAAAACLGISRTKFVQMDDTGQVPLSIRFGKRKLWRYRELVAWTDAGCPHRDRWIYKAH